MSTRLSKYETASKALSNLSDKDLAAKLSASDSFTTATGGEGLTIEVEGVPVFVKKIRLTALEKEQPHATHNLFQLPTQYQFGVGSQGFGAWRELAAHQMTTQWVLEGECHNFPLMYHYKIMDRTTPRPSETEIEANRKRDLETWEDAEPVGKRSEALDRAPSHILIFMEHIPQNLSAWLSTESAKGTLTEKKAARLEQEANHVAAYMKSKGFLHMDGHDHNIQATPEHVYFSDFGLAMSDRFALSLQERAFFEKHQDYDRYYVAAKLVEGLLVATTPARDIDSIIPQKKPCRPSPLQSAPPRKKYRPIALIMENFLQDLREKSKSTPFPADALAQEWAKIH